MATMHLKTVSLREDGCFGVLIGFDEKPFAVTLERTFEGLRTVIGNGMHQCHLSHFHRGNYPTFEIEVPGHDRVLFHKGNVESDSAGCVLVAESFGELNRQTAVLDSKGGFNEFMRLCGGRTMFWLDVSGR